jgi:hypothetical protein
MSNQYVTDGLRVKLAEIISTMRVAEQRLRKLAHDKAIITAALRLFDQDGTEVPALGIPRGSFTRIVLETLRDADKPLSIRDIAERLATGKTLDKRQMGMLVARVRNAVPRLSDQLEGDLRERTTFWRMKDNRPVISGSP